MYYYKLIGTINHKGDSKDHGHFYNFIKKDGEWYEVNDDKVFYNKKLDDLY